jgi:hypothetical protein
VFFSKLRHGALDSFESFGTGSARGCAFSVTMLVRALGTISDALLASSLTAARSFLFCARMAACSEFRRASFLS